MKRIISFLLVTGIIIAGVTFLSKDSESPSDSSSTSVATTTVLTGNKNATTTTGGTITSYALSEVEMHKTSTDCWTAINGSVYNVTDWISKHPGGAKAIMALCGIDGSAFFNGQHDGQKRPATELASFKIGVLKQS